MSGNRSTPTSQLHQTGEPALLVDYHAPHRYSLDQSRQRKPRAVNTETIRALERAFGDRMTTNTDILVQHGRDESFHAAAAPEVVVYPLNNEEVQYIVRVCSDNQTPLIPYGAGTSLEGHVNALHGGVCLDMSRMNRIIEIHEQDLDVRVQAGVVRKQLERELRPLGLFFPVDPGADATLGGMVATGASGTNAVRYGTMRENLLGLTLVTADGQIQTTGSRARKSASGYDLTRLFCGSEGTLGVITEISLKCHGLPEAYSAAVCPFETLEGAVQSVTEVIQSGIPVARIELLDALHMTAVNAYSGLDYAEKPTLFFEFQGTWASVAEQSRHAAEIVSEQGGGDFRWSTRQEEQSRLWKARHDAYYAAKAMRPGCQGWPTDVCVPLSRLAECILATRADVEESDFYAPIVGHVGDGNFHLQLLVKTGDPDEMRIAREINERLIKRALSMGGTMTGEHGVGSGKLAYMELEHGQSLNLMRTIKQALDPHNIMNPGKVIPGL